MEGLGIAIHEKSPVTHIEPFEYIYGAYNELYHDMFELKGDPGPHQSVLRDAD